MATYYWVGGTGTWSGTGNTQFAITSGGAPTLLNPTNADIVIFDANSGTAATVTVTATAVASNTTINKADINLSLSGNATLTNTSGSCALTTGTITLNTYTLTCAFFDANNSNTRAIAFGTGNITVTGSGTTVWAAATLTGLTITGTPIVNLTYAGATGTRTINHGLTAGGSASTAISANVSAGTDGLNPVGYFVNLNLTGYAGPITSQNRFYYGSLTLSSGCSYTLGANTENFVATSGVQKITSAGKTINNVTINGVGTTVQLQDNLTISSTLTCTLTNGTLDLTGNSGNWSLSTGVFSSTNTNTRSIAFGTGNITVTSTAATLWNVSTLAGMTYTGTPLVVLSATASSGTRTIDNGATSGGTEANAISVNVTGGSGTATVTFSNSLTTAYKNLNFTGFSGSLANVYCQVYGNVIFSSSMTLTAGTNELRFFATSGVQQITTNAKTLDFPITQNGIGGTVQLQDNLTLGSTRAFTLTNGTLDLAGNSGNWTLNAGLFSSNNVNARTIAFGTGKIIVAGNNTSVWFASNITNLTVTGTSNVEFTYAGATGTRTISHGQSAGGSEARAISFSITAGTDIVTLTGSGSIKNLNFTGFSGTWTNSGAFIYGNLTISSGMTVGAGATTVYFNSASATQNITSATKTLDFPISIGYLGTEANTLALQDNLTMGITRSFALISGTLNLTGNSGNWTLTTGVFGSSYSTVRSIAFGTGNITVIGSGSVWNTGNVTNFSYTGTPTVNISNNSATATTVATGSPIEARALNFNYTTGTYTLTDTSAVYKSVNFTGFSGTIPNSTRTIYGGATFVAGMTLTAGANATTFAATSGTNNITTAKTWDFPITVFGLGGTFAFQDALTMGSTRAFTLTAGTVKFKAGTTNTVGSFVATSGTTKYLQSTTPGSQATISDASGVNSVNNLTIQDSFATGGATWDAFYGNGNIDGGNNTNWEFGESPVLGNEYEYKLRSMTERRRF